VNVQDELGTFRGWRGDVATLSPPETFLHAMARVPRVRTKLQCLLFQRQFSALGCELHAAFTTIQRAIVQVCWLLSEWSGGPGAV
jgi:hypothetical protein